MGASILNIGHKMSAPIGAKSASIIRNPVSDGYERKSALIPSALDAPMEAYPSLSGCSGVSRQAMAHGKNYDGQSFFLVAVEGYANKSGRQCRLGIWQSNCGDCGKAFTFKLSLRGDFRPIRRCDDHKAPGKRVRRSI